MPKVRSYRLLCPIARALDRIGDRWTLLILRDLHSGPARFSDLQRGLTGIAANLLSERLAKLIEDDLIEKGDGGHGSTIYRLTGLGARTGDIIFELARYGAQFRPEGDVVRPGNLRTIATTMGAAAKRVALPGMAFRAAIRVDGEEMQLAVADDRAEMLYGPCPDPDLVFETTYEALLAVSEGELPLEIFARDHGRLEVSTPGKEAPFLKLMADIVALLTA